MLEVMIKWQIKIVLLNLDHIASQKEYQVLDFSNVKREWARSFSLGNIYGFCNVLKIIFEGC